MIRCSKCVMERQATGSRLPRGWHRHDENPVCATCWSDAHILRAVVFPVIEPLDSSWDELNASLKAMFIEVTRVSNWMVTELAKRDIRRDPQQPKIPAMPRVYLYPEARAQFPSIPPQSVSSIEQAVQRKYRSKRYDVIWRCSASLPSYRFPQPFPVHNQSWSAAIIEDRPQVSVRVAERRFALRLKGGARYRRQLQMFRAIVSGNAARGELAIYRSGSDLMCKMVAWIPRNPAKPALDGTLHVRSSADALLVAFNAKDEAIWRWNAPQIRRWAAEHRHRLQMWSEDQKAEQRPVPAFARTREDASRRYHHRLDTAAKQAAAYVASYAARRKFAAVEYNDAERSWCPEFVWHTLKERLKIALDERRIELVLASGPVVQDSPAPLEQSENDNE